MRLFLRARAVINFLMRAASTLKIINGEQRALRKFSACWNLSLLEGLVLRQVIWLIFQNRTTGAKLGDMIRPYRGSTIPVAYSQLCLQEVRPCLTKYWKLLKTGSLDNAVRKFSLAQPSWYMSHYNPSNHFAYARLT